MKKTYEQFGTRFVPSDHPFEANTTNRNPAMKMARLLTSVTLTAVSASGSVYGAKAAVISVNYETAGSCTLHNR